MSEKDVAEEYIEQLEVDVEKRVRKIEELKLLAEQFFYKTGLYQKLELVKDDYDIMTSELHKSRNIDCYCVKCQKESTFSHGGSNNPIYRGINVVRFSCQRERSHELSFIFYFSDRFAVKSIQKVGQYPSMADLAMIEFKKYNKVLDEEYHQELTKAVGLFAHGVGAGSFVYLRRIFEFLIHEAYQKASDAGVITEDEYIKKRMDEKIECLQYYLPKFLVDHKTLYGIMSKGVHELDESTCKEYFPVILESIEIILDEKEAERLKENRQNSLSSRINKLHATLNK